MSSADLRHRSIPAMARASAQQYAGRVAVVDGDATLTFEEVARLMRRVAASLRASGVRPGDRVGLWAPNSALWITAALGIQAAGGWLVPLNTRYVGGEAASILRRCRARAVVVVDEFLGQDYAAVLGEADPGLECLEVTVRLPGPGQRTSPEWEAFLARGQAIDDAEVDAMIDRIGPDDVSDIIYTSGTTGEPKGVLLAHGASLRAYESYNTAFGLAEGQVQLIGTPFFHCFGYKAGWMLSLLVGATTVPMAVFDPLDCLRLVERHRVTHMPGSPTLFWSMINHPDRGDVDVSSLSTVMLAAASIPVELVHAVRRDLGVGATLTGYGLTENHALGTFTAPDDDPELVTTTVGRPAPDLEMRVVDGVGGGVAPGEAGELQIRGYAHMLGYFEDPAATADAFDDGWLRTGDVASIDERGYVTIRDRMKDIYIMGGFNVAPAEVEAALIRMTEVEEVAVIGRADDRFGEVGVAFVVPSVGAVLAPDDVIAYAREHLANFKIPREVVVLDELPHNATGKVLKPVLRRLLDEKG